MPRQLSLLKLLAVGSDSSSKCIEEYYHQQPYLTGKNYSKLQLKDGSKGCWAGIIKYFSSLTPSLINPEHMILFLGVKKKNLLENKLSLDVSAQFLVLIKSILLHSPDFTTLASWVCSSVRFTILTWSIQSFSPSSTLNRRRKWWLSAWLSGAEKCKVSWVGSRWIKSDNLCLGWCCHFHYIYISKWYLYSAGLLAVCSCVGSNDHT